jgi:hypothetical protein
MRRGFRSNLHFLTLAAVASLAASACQHAAARRDETGTSSVRFIEPPSALSAGMKAEPAAALQPVDVLVPAEPIEPLAKPVYPRAVLGRQTTPVLVGLRIRIDASGRVADSGPSLASFSTPGPFDAEFRAAIEAALAQWQFRPAELRRLKPVKGPPGKEDYWVIVRAEKADYALDVSFTFNASGDVLAGLPRK